MTTSTDPFAGFTGGVSYIDPITGQPVEGAASAPVGTPFYRSSTLVNGISSTATPDNPFAGFVNELGGRFGDDAAGTAEDAAMNTNLATAAAAPIDQTAVDPTQLSTLGQEWAQFLQSGGSSLLDPSTGAVSGTPNPMDQIRAKASQGTALTATEQEFLATVGGNGLATGRGGPVSPYRFDASGHATYDPQLGRVAGVGPDGKPLTGDYQQQLIAQGLLTPDQAARLNANAAAANVASATANAPPADTDADPFGQFESAQHPTHGVITPAYEKSLADAAQAKLVAETQPGAVAPRPGATATITTPSSTPAGVATASTIPVMGTAPSTVSAADPFAPFIDPTTGQPIPAGGTAAPAQIKAPTFGAATPTLAY